MKLCEREIRAHFEPNPTDRQGSVIPTYFLWLTYYQLIMNKLCTDFSCGIAISFGDFLIIRQIDVLLYRETNGSYIFIKVVAGLSSCSN